MNRRLATILVILGIVFFIFGFWLYINQERGDDIISGDVVEEIAEGVFIVEGSVKGASPSAKASGDKVGRVLRNERDGYEVVVSDKKVVEEKNGFSFYNDDNADFPVYTIRVLDNNGLDLNAWLQKYHEEKWLMFYDEKEIFELGSQKGYKIKNEGSPEYFSYYFLSDNDIFIISTPQPEKFEYIVTTLKLFN